MSKIKDFILNYIEKKGNLAQNAASDGFDFLKTGYIDSIAIFEFIVILEEKFDIEFSDEEISLPGFTTIGGLTQIISQKLGDKNDEGY